MRSPNDLKNLNINLADFKISNNNLNNNNYNNNHYNNQISNARSDLSPNDRNLINKNPALSQNNFINNNSKINNSSALQQQQSSSAAAKIYKPLDAKETEAFNLTANTDIINYDSREDENLKSFDCEDFKVITQIGEGSFGKIYHVEDKYKRQFSMKKIIANDEMDVENFTQEYELVNKVRQKNILRIHSICRRRLDSTTHALYILMEKGVTDWEKEIKARQLQKKFYSEKELFNILGQLTDALAFLQMKNISHRDIKPQNVLLFKEGIFKIADFGEAKKISIIETCKQLSTLRGTELYMSPLLFNGLRIGQNDIKHNSFKSDVFSLGFCFFYAATLNIHCLYELRRETDTFNIVFKLERAIKGRYSVNLVNVLLKMLEINENKRCDFIELQALLKEIN
jgi:serine/threonine protein kinase